MIFLDSSKIRNIHIFIADYINIRSSIPVVQAIAKSVNKEDEIKTYRLLHGMDSVLFGQFYESFFDLGTVTVAKKQFEAELVVDRIRYMLENL